MSAAKSLANSLSGGSETPFARTIAAIDMTGNSELRGLWFPGASIAADLAARSGLPAGGYPSPLGYWLVKHDGLVPPSSTGLHMVVSAPGEEAPELAIRPGESHQAGRQFRTQTVKIKRPGPDAGDLFVTIGPGTARVIARESAWEALAEPIILAVCQVWRFQSIEAEIERLTVSALEDLSHANVPGLASLERFAFGLRTETIHIEGHDRGRRRQRIRRYLPCVPLR